MLGRFIAWFSVVALHHKRLTEEDRLRVLNAILENLNAIHHRNVVRVNPEGSLSIGLRTLSREATNAFLESARALRDNTARKAIHDQIAYEATKIGINKALTPEMIQFGKAAIWWGEQENELIDKLIP